MSGTQSSDNDGFTRIIHTDDVLGGQPRIAGTRISVLFVYERVEGRGLDPQTVADRHDLDVADVYRALTYYHDNPREMEQVRREREAAVEQFHEGIDRPPGVEPPVDPSDE